VLPAVWSLHNLSRQLLHDPGNLMDGSIFYPYRLTIATLDHQLVAAVMATPLVEGGANGAQIYNLSFLASFVLSGCFSYLLIRRLTGSTAAGLVGGCAYAFSSYRALHLPQAHLLATEWLPLALFTLHRFLERPVWTRWLALAAATLAVALASWHMAVIGAVAIGLVAVWTMAGRPEGLGRKLTGLALVAIICGAALLPLASAYSRMGNQWPPRTGEGRETVDTLSNLSADLVGLAASPENSRAPYASLVGRFASGRPGVFPGLVAVLLSLPALAWLWRHRSALVPTGLLRWWLLGSAALTITVTLAAAAGGAGAMVVSALRPVAPVVLLGLALGIWSLRGARGAAEAGSTTGLVWTYAALAAAGAILALGPRVHAGSIDIGSGLWRLDLLPVRLIMRAPERLSLLLALGTAVLAGVGVARLLKDRRPAARLGLTVVLLVLINVDLGFRSPSLLEVPGPAAVDRWLADAPEQGAVIDYPLLWTNRWAVYKSQEHGRRIVNGTGYLLPSEYLVMESFPDLSPGQLNVIWEYFHPRFVVIRSDVYTAAERQRVVSDVAAQPDALVLRGRWGPDSVYELFDRGRGQELLRRWPSGAMWNATELELQGLVTPGRDDTAGRLVVVLNGRTLLETDPGDAETSATYRIPFSRDDLVWGTNLFQIAAGYDFVDTAERHPIGTTGLSLPADVMVTSDRERATVEINGRLLRLERGYLLVALDPDNGRIVEAARFDTSWTAEASDAMRAFIDRLAPGTPVVVASEFDVSRELTAGAVDALHTLGLTADLRGQFQSMHAGIGVKGAPPGSALEVTDRITARLTLGTPDRRAVQLESLRLR